MDYLPFWLGGLALGGVSIWSWVIEGRTLGITAQVTGVVDAATNPTVEREAVAFANRDPNDILAALAAATAAETGEVIEPPTRTCETAEFHVQDHVPVAQRIGFLLFIAVGAAAGALLDGSFEIRTDLGTSHNAFVGEGWTRTLLVLGGGVAVGFGTRMAGGCTSGHGLTGCARMLPRSLIATCVFLGTAIGFTLVTKALM